MLNFNSIMIGSSQPKVLAAFYEKALGRAPDMSDEGWSGWKIGDCFLNVGAHSEVNGSAKEPQRIIINFETEDVKGEFERMKAAAHPHVIREPYTMEGMPDFWIATLADPDGNYFQLMTPWKGE